MFGFQSVKNAPPFNFPKTKLKNVTCVHCKHQFIVQEFSHMRGQLIPLLLECGHSVCYGCAKSYPNKPCSLCKVRADKKERSAESYPLSIYALGLVVVASNRPVDGEDPDISFYQALSTKMRQIHKQGTCYECEVDATLRCLQCNALYCQACYSKIHGRALQKHTKVALLETVNKTPSIVGNTCSDSCNELLGYFCKDCKVYSCSHCMLRLHSKHEHITLEERNKELMESFQKAYNENVESLQRIQQTEKKLKTIRMSPSEIQNHETIEASITQHFAHLHGILQNMERRMIDKIYERRSYFNKNLTNVESQLRSEEDRLQALLSMAANAKDNIDKINMEEVLCKLKEVADVPCHLVQNLVVNDEKMCFTMDEDIIDTIENHCTLNIPPIPEFNLLSSKLLPEDYQPEALTQEVVIWGKNNDNGNSNNLPPSDKFVAPRSSISASLTSLRSDNSYQTCPSELVKVMNVADPSCFYVQLWSNQRQAEELSKSLEACSTTAPHPTKEITTGKMYMVEYSREKVWRRGRVTKIHWYPNSPDNCYDILYVDSGYYERNVPISRLKMISPQHSSIPILAAKCSLHGVVPKGERWSKVAIEEFRKLTEIHVPFTMHTFYTNGNTSYVDLCFYSNGTEGTIMSMRDTMILAEHGNYVSLQRLMRTNPLSLQTFFREELEMQKYVDVAVQRIEAPDRIYVTKIGENQKHVNKLMKDMTAFYDKNLNCPSLDCQLDRGVPCAVLHLDGLWYRGVITNIFNEENIEVFCVDFGYLYIVNHKLLRRLTVNYMNATTQAIQVFLKDLQPTSENGEWNLHGIDFLKKCLTNQKVRVIPFEKIKDSYGVYLYAHGTTNINTLMAEKRFVNYNGTTLLMVSPHPQSLQMPTLQSAPALMSTNKKRRPKRKRSIRSDQSSTQYVEENKKQSQDVQTSIEPDPFKVCVQVLEAESPDCIYVADISREQANMELTAKMQDFYTKYHSQEKINWTKDAVCAIYSKKDKNYLRGRIVEILPNEEEALVFFYDMAIEEPVPIKHIQPLHTKFQQEPAYYFKVKLAGILPCGGSNVWPSSSCQKLNEIITDNQTCHFYITKVADSGDSTEIPVQLWIKQSRTDGPVSPTKIEINSVNKMLVEAGLALPVKGYNDQMIDKILAVELKRQLQGMPISSSQNDNNAKWFLTSEGTSESSIESSEDEEKCMSMINLSNTSSPKKLTDWLPPLAITSNHFIAVPTYVDDDGIIYLHPEKEGEAMLRDIEMTLNDFYKRVKIRPCDKVWQKGDMCIAQYHSTKKWYRGRVVNIIDDQNVEVLFVDYGNVEECAIGTVKKRTILTHIPIQCTPCMVCGLNSVSEDGEWNRDDLDKIHSLLVEKKCKVNVIERRDTHLIVSITLLKPKKCDLIAYLTNELGIRLSANSMNSSGSKIFNETNSSDSSTDSPDVIIEKYTKDDKTISDAYTDSELVAENIVDVDNIISGNSVLITDIEDTRHVESFESSLLDNVEIIKQEATFSTPQVMSVENLVNYIPLVIPDDIEIFEVELCVTTIATEHYAQLGKNEDIKVLNDCYNRYHRLMKDIQKEAAEQPLIGTLAPNTPCCAMFTDDVWYRCIIQTSEFIEDTDICNINLYYVDFGNEEERQVKLNESGLRTLKEEWLSVPAMAIKCHLWHIAVPENVDFLLLTKELEKMYMMYNRYTIVKIKERYEDYLDVELYADKKCTKLLYRYLIKCGYLQVKKAKED